MKRAYARDQGRLAPNSDAVNLPLLFVMVMKLVSMTLNRIGSCVLAQCHPQPRLNQLMMRTGRLLHRRPLTNLPCFRILKDQPPYPCLLHLVCTGLRNCRWCFLSRFSAYCFCSLMFSRLWRSLFLKLLLAVFLQVLVFSILPMVGDTP